MDNQQKSRKRNISATTTVSLLDEATRLSTIGFGLKGSYR